MENLFVLKDGEMKLIKRGTLKQIKDYLEVRTFKRIERENETGFISNEEFDRLKKEMKE